MSKTLSERDRALLWHPFTNEKTADLPIVISWGKGSYVYDEEGKAYLDLISSWWVNLHGHAHPDIANAIYQQAMKLEHVMFSGYTHAPAVELCEKLNVILPSSLCRFFYSDNGSTAVEVAIKMAYQYWRNQSEKNRHLFLSFEGGYHGDTFGAMALGAKNGFHDVFEDLFFSVLSIPFPSTWMNDHHVEEKESKALDELDRLLASQGESIAAFILEPLVQGASGMRFCRAQFIEEVVKRIRKHGILVIYDEVMTGFGRTGTLFALEQINVEPDFLCLSKGISGGFLPLALTVTTQTVYEAFLGFDNRKVFLHGHSYTANPLACAAANASLSLLLNEETQKAIQAIQEAHQVGLNDLQKYLPLEKMRTIGTISAFELETLELAQTLKMRCLSRGLMIRPLGKTVYLIPPYCTSYQELISAYESMQ